ncbi:MAG: 6-phosphogluconolactonase [Cyanobacteria bacterium P01_A01_bin.17]
MTQPKIEVLADASTLVQRAAELVVAEAQQAIAQRDRFTIALSGGNTPKPLYEQLAEKDLPWSKVHIFWGDERYVPADHADSNAGMARKAWLDRVPLPAENIHPMATDAADPADAARTHEQHLNAFFGSSSEPGQFPQLDVVLLGIGPDGHTASLFPHTEALQVCDRSITVGNKDGQPRITFTIPILNRARCVIFLVTGENKRTALEQIFAEQANSSQWPARLVQPQDGQLIWLLDQSAGQELTL